MAATINVLTNKFVHVSYQAGSTTYFADNNANSPSYYVVTGDTSSEALLESATLPASGTVNVVPFTSIAYMTFEDGTTAIVTHLELYGKAGAAPTPSGDTTPVKLVEVAVGAGEQGEFPGVDDYIYEDTCPYQDGDIVVVRSVWSGVAQNFKVGLVRGVIDMEDSGVQRWTVDYELIYDTKSYDDRLKALEEWANSTTSFA
ncbi:MAG: hypothetical protein J6T60_05850 [Bacteroidales bacterium]|nr:hypothetical protein [Bacteroidales bacterium]